MSVAAQEDTIKVALIGNPNTGKSTLFNSLCGLQQRVGNFPGVTVEKKVGNTEFHGRRFEIIDLPGSYSLAPRSPDEMVAVDVLLGHQANVARPDVVVCIVDASNLQRNLYLLSQLLELGIPTVLALNMVDLLGSKGVQLDVGRLRDQLPVPVVEIQANKRRGLEALKSAIFETAGAPPYIPKSPFPAPFQNEVAELVQKWSFASGAPPRYLAERLLLDTSEYLSKAGLPGVTPALLADVGAARERLAEADCPVPAIEAMARYDWIGQLTAGAVRRDEQLKKTFSDRLDRVLTHRLWGSLFFALLMMMLFQSVFYIAEPASWLIDLGNGHLAGLISALLTEGPLQSLLINGVVAGVGGVLVFLPQIFLLFFFIAVLEDCGYMARAAYLMDKLMSRIGLSGKSFIPLLSSFACAIPGIMAARVIENPKDRLITILVAPLMTCSARLPVYTLLIGAFIPQRSFAGGLLGLQGLTMFALYALGITAAVAVALLLRKTLVRGRTPPFVMELPAYKVPGAWIVLHRMLDRGWAFVRRAGTLIFAVTILVWAAGYYPRDANRLDPTLVERRDALGSQLATAMSAVESERVAAELQVVEHRIEGDYLQKSYLGRTGRWIEPIVRPLGWDWRIGCAAIASFPAREVVIATLGVIYNLGADEAEDSLGDSLRAATWDGTERPVFNVPVALSLMVFFALCAQCASTLAVMKRETNSWKWPAFTFIYMTALAYVAALLTYQLGMLLFVN
jgi:ferrous iron transport protein B